MTGIFWLEQTLCDVPAANDWLAGPEQARLAAIRFSRRREDWRLGRWAAKQALAARLGLPGSPAGLAAIEIRASPGGAPEAFLAGRKAEVSISLSHRAGIGFCSIAPGRTLLGCDIEAVEPRSPAFLEDYFTTEEQELIHHAGEASRDRLTTLLWSAKESVLKALGVGLRRATTDIRVHPAGTTAAGIWQPLCAQTIDGGIFRCWYRESGALLRTIAVGAPGAHGPLHA